MVKGTTKERGIDGLDACDAERRLHGECSNGGGSEEAMGAKGLKVGGDARATGGIMTRKGE